MCADSFNKFEWDRVVVVLTFYSVLEILTKTLLIILCSITGLILLCPMSLVQHSLDGRKNSAKWTFIYYTGGFLKEILGSKISSVGISCWKKHSFRTCEEGQNILKSALTEIIEFNSKTSISWEFKFTNESLHLCRRGKVKYIASYCMS